MNVTILKSPALRWEAQPRAQVSGPCLRDFHPPPPPAPRPHMTSHCHTGNAMEEGPTAARWGLLKDKVGGGGKALGMRHRDDKQETGKWV